MTYFFYGLATVVLLIGLAWCGLILSQPMDENHLTLAMMARALSLLPGAGVAGSGLIFLAIAGVLGRLDKIARSSADMADAMDILSVQTPRL